MGCNNPVSVWVSHHTLKRWARRIYIMTKQYRITATSTRKEIVAELQRMEGYLYNDITWYATQLGHTYKGEQTYKSDLQDIYKKVSSSYMYKMKAMQDAKEVGLNLNAKNYTLKQVRNKVLEAIGEDMDMLDKKMKEKKAKVIVYEESESVTDEDVKKLEKVANKQAKAEEREMKKAQEEVKAAMEEVAATVQPQQEEEVTMTQEQLIAEAVAKAVAAKEEEMKAQHEKEMKAVVTATVEMAEEANKEVVDEAVESVIELYDALDQKGKEILEQVKETDKAGDFEQSDKLMDEYDQVMDKRDELGDKHENVTFSKERAEAMLHDVRQGLADGLRTTAGVTNKYGNAGVDTLVDVANQILAGTVKVAETIIKGGEAIAQTGINVAGTVGKAGVKGVSGTLNAAADIVEPKQK